MNELEAKKQAPEKGIAKPLRQGTERILDEGNRAKYEEALYKLALRCGPTASTTTLSIRKAKRPIDGKIDPMNWDIKVTMDRNAHFRADKRLERYLEKMGIKDPFLALVEDIGKHEIGHWEYPRGSGVGCPFDNKLYHEAFLGPAYEELKKSGRFSEGFCKQWAKRVANAAMDIVDNWNAFVNCVRGGNGSGQVLFWYLMGQHGGTYSPEYTLFVRLNLILMDSKEAHNLLGAFFCTKAVDRHERDVKVAEMIGESVVKMKGILTPENMLDKGRWEMITRAYTEEVAKYIIEGDKPKGQTSAGDKTAAPPQGSGEGESGGEGQKGENGSEEKEGEEKGGTHVGGEGEKEGEEEEEDGEGSGEGKQEGEGDEEEGEEGSGKGEKGEEDEDEDEEGEGDAGGKEKPEKGGEEVAVAGGEKQGGEEDEDETDGEEGEEGNPFERLSPKDIEQIMGERAAAGKGRPFYVETKKAVDAYYKFMSRRFIVRGTKGELPSASYPAVPVRRRPFDGERDDVSAADMGRLYFDPVKRRMVPSVVTHYHSTDMPITKSMKDFPKIIYLFADASGSMMCGGGDTSIVPWGDRSGYHFVLLTYYGLLAQVEYMQLLHKVDVCAGAFSSITLFARGLEASKERLLNPVSGGTNIDIDAMEKMFAGVEGALFPFISDGVIDNWATVKDRFIAIAKRQQTFMVQVGPETDTSRDLRAAGIKVERMDSYEKFVQPVVDFGAKVYTTAKQQKLETEKKKYRDLRGR